MSRSSERRWRHRLRCERGQAAVELAVVTPLLLILFLGIFEFGRAFELVHALGGLSREGANLAARGVPLDQAVTVTLSNGQDIQLSTQGGVIATRLSKSAGKLTVDDQVATAGYAGRSHYGVKGGAPINLTPATFSDGQTVYVVELFYRYSTVTPFKVFTKTVFPDELYARTFF
jgi:Flp pilus assembly protein TadG